MRRGTPRSFFWSWCYSCRPGPSTYVSALSDLLGFQFQIPFSTRASCARAASLIGLVHWWPEKGGRVMKTFVIAAVFLSAASIPRLAAQRGGASGGVATRAISLGAGRSGRRAGWTGSRPPANSGQLPSRPFLKMAFDRSQVRGTPHYRYGRHPPVTTYPAQSYSPFADLGMLTYDQPSYQRRVILVTPAPFIPPEPPLDAQGPPKPLVRECSWPSNPDDLAGTFSIALQDGTVRFAVAVWVQDGMAHYIGENGTAERASLAAIDRETTYRLNAEHGLKLRL
jgi:hypothetical protein